MPGTRNVPPAVAHTRARHARAARDKDPQRLAESAADLREAVAEDTIRRIVDQAPPLTQAQRAKLAVLLLNPRARMTPPVAGRKTPTAAGAGSDQARRGQVFGFALALIAFGGAIGLSVIGMPNVGAMFLSVPVLAVITAFAVGR